MQWRRWLQWAAVSIAAALVLGVAPSDGSEATVAASGSARPAYPAGVEGTCRRRDDCGSPLKSGLRITFTGWACTTAFFARSATKLTPYLITAGHCISASGPFAQWSHGGATIGRAALNAFVDGSSADVGAIEIDSLPFDNLLYATGNTDLRPLHGQLPDVAQTVGSEVCRSGGASGWACGHIVAADVDTRIAGKRIRHSWWTDFPSVEGDSGGPVIDPAGHLLGIVVATTTTQSVYSTVESIMRELDIRACADPACTSSGGPATSENGLLGSASDAVAARGESI